MTNSVFNLSDLDDTKGFALKGINAYDGSGSSVSGAAVDKVTITLPDSHFQLFDTLSPTEISLLSGFAINGIDIGDISGFSVSGAGDINGDGIDDLIIGAKYASPNDNDKAGESYVIFGSDQEFSASLDLSTLNGSNGFVINGIRGIDAMFEASGDASGFSVSGAGDINGDGINDLIIGAPYADLNGFQVGESYVVFGSDQGFSASLDLSTLDGSNGFVINNDDIDASFDETGFSVSGAGDINGDGFDDLIIGAPYADAYISYTRAGKSYVVFGSDQVFTPRFDLSSLDGNNGFAINGIDIGDESGFSVSGAGDINGDGFDDLIIGAPIAKPNSVNQAGESYVVFGSDQGFGANLDLATLNGNNGFVIEGAYSSGLLGWSVSGAGDIDGDGFDDLIIGARRGANPNGNWSTGEIYVIFGKSGNFKSNLNITDLNGTNGFIIYGINSFDYAGWSVSDAGDVNGDGFDDLIIGAPQAPINPEGKSQSYVVFGKANGFLPHFNLSDLDGNKGFVINGIDGGDRSGSSVSGAGDINNDGFDDLIIGAPSADPNGIISAGESYVVFGRSQFTASLDLANLSSKTANVFENSPNATIIADLSTTDPDEEDNHTYTLLNNGGGRFAIEGNQLIVADGSLLDFESNDTHTIEIQTTDGAGLNFSQLFTLNVIDVNENPVPTGIILSDSTIAENSPNSTIIGNLSTIDPSEGDSHTYTLLDDAGGRFALEGNQLIVADGSLLDFESNDSHVIEIQTTDSTGLSFSQSFTIIVIDDVNEAKAPTRISLLQGFVINGIDSEDVSGYSVSGAGDINGDGFADLIIGAENGDPNRQKNAGEAYVVFGFNQNFSESFDLSDLDGRNGFIVEGLNSFDFLGGSVSRAGDINGDGFADIIIGATGADPNGSNAGSAYVIFGSNQEFLASFDLSDLNGSNGFIITGLESFNLGSSVSDAGDINGDGFDDLIVGAPSATPNDNYRAGTSYVIFGSDQGFAANLDVATLNGSNGFVINGIATFGGLGETVSSAGDINGDGLDDLILGASSVDLDGKSGAGESYVIFGSNQDFAASLDLSTLNGSNGFVIKGIDAGDFSGYSVSNAGDINGDGIDDLIIGAREADPNGKDGAGESYLVFGSNQRFPAILDLSTLNGSNGFVINGINSGDRSSRPVSNAGDINGDGIDDLIIGASDADPNGESYAGESYVIFGSNQSFPASFELSALNGSNGFIIKGIDSFDKSGYSVSAAGDINGDGFDELIIGAYSANPNSVNQAGESYVVFGRSQFTMSLELANLSSKTANVFENSPNGTIIADLSTNDLNTRDTHTYTILDSAGGRFAIESNQLIVADESLLDFESNDTHTIAIQTTDEAGLSFSQTFTIVVFGVPDLEIGLYDTDTDALITPIKNDDVISAGILPNGNVTIAAFVPENSRFFGDIESIFLDLNQGDVTRTENVEPYALFGDFPPGDFKAGSGIPLGDNSISFKLYSGDGLSGDFLGTVTRSFSIVEDPDMQLSDLDGTNGFALNGINERDGSGGSVSGAGDVNGDGFDDLIVGASGADPNGNFSGQSYVVFGSDGGFPASLELADLNGINGFALNGINKYDDSGSSVSGAGDINGDGFDDLIIGAPFASPNGTFSGQSYVVFGSDGGFPASVDLNDLDGSNGFVLNGINPEDLLGFSVSGAGDVNGDGFDDLIIGATGFPMGQSIGQSYVVFGSGGEFPDSIDLADLNGSNGFVLNGINPDDFSGRSVSGAGDVNGDGFDDLILGSARVGERYVVFGSGGGFPASLDLANLDGRNGFVLNGISQYNFSGTSVSGAGDINGDGFDDLIIGDDSADPNGNIGAGQSYVVFGSDGGFPARLDLNNLDGSNGFVLNGINASDGSGSSVSGAGDVNGDGFDDLIVGASSADSNGNIRTGQSYVVFGSDSGFSASLELSALNGKNGFALNGINERDYSGGSVSGAGDVNGDGIDDLIVGARGADPNGDASGQSYVVFGVPDLEIGLYDTDTDTLITPIKNDDVIPASILPNGNVTIAAFVPENSRFFGDIESIFLDLNQGDVTQTENVEPYALFGDVPPGDFQAGSGIPLGDNSISFKLYSGDGLSGDLLGTVTRSFSIVKDLDIGLYDAVSDELITPLNEGDELLASTLKDRNVTIAAFVPEDSLFFNQVESMGLNLNDGEVIRTENIEPYSLFGDINGNYNGGALPLGDNKIAFELYPDDNLQGGLLDTVSRNFTITNDL